MDDRLTGLTFSDSHALQPTPASPPQSAPTNILHSSFFSSTALSLTSNTVENSAISTSYSLMTTPAGDDSPQQLQTPTAQHPINVLQSSFFASTATSQATVMAAAPCISSSHAPPLAQPLAPRPATVEVQPALSARPPLPSSPRTSPDSEPRSSDNGELNPPIRKLANTPSMQKPTRFAPAPSQPDTRRPPLRGVSMPVLVDQWQVRHSRLSDPQAVQQQQQQDAEAALQQRQQQQDAAAAAAAAQQMALPPRRVSGGTSRAGFAVTVGGRFGRPGAAGSSLDLPRSSGAGRVLPPDRHSGLLMSSAANLRFSMDDGDTCSSTSLSGAFSVATERPSYTAAGLQRALEKLMLQDKSTFARVQASMKGISSLAKETSTLELGHDPTGATIMNQYVIVKTLGRGSFGKVKLCLNTLDGRLYAVKMVNRAFVLRQLLKPGRNLRRRTGKSSAQQAVATAGSEGVPNSSSLSAGFRFSADETRRPADPMDSMTSTSQAASPIGPLESVMREIAVLKKLDHPNVVRLFEVIDPDGTGYMMMVMEYMERGPVLETRSKGYFDRFPEDVALNYFRQVCRGLDYLHYNSVVHGDLKPENLLLSAHGELKIGDFGSSRIINDIRSSSKVSCTPAFQSPEALQGGLVPEDPFAADVWALGVCLYCFVYGCLPFSGSCVLDVSKAIMQEEVQYPAEVPVSAELRDLFDRIFVKDPTRRITLQDIMSHPWTSDLGSAPLPSIKQQLAPPVPLQATRGQAMQAIQHVSLVSLIRARLKEKTCQPGEYLFRERDEAHCVYMIMSGVVEMVAHCMPKVSLGAVEELAEGFTLDIDESFHLESGIRLPAASVNEHGKLVIDKEQAAELKKRMNDLIMGRGDEYVSEVRGPGQVIGEVSLDQERVVRHRYGARAKTLVVVVKLTEENLLKALTQTYGSEGSEPNALSTVESLMGAMTDDFADRPSAMAASRAGSGFGGGVNISPHNSQPSNVVLPRGQSSLATIHDEHDDPNLGNL